MSMLFRRRLPLAPALLATALLAGAFLVAVPALVSAQPPPPHLFFGQVADVTINGAAWDGSLIEVIDEDGDVVATVNRDGDAWTVFVPPDAGSVRFRLGDAISQSFAISGGSLTQVALVLVDGGPGRTVLLVAGFNFVVWTGATMSVDDALASSPTPAALPPSFRTLVRGRPGTPTAPAARRSCSRSIRSANSTSCSYSPRQGPASPSDHAPFVLRKC